MPKKSGKRTASRRRTGRGAKRSRKGSAAGKAFAAIASAAVILYLAAGAYLYLNQDSLVFHPTPAVNTSEQEITIEAEGAVLRGWAVNPGREHAIIYFGGNAEQIEHSMPDFKALFTQHTLYFVNYRGYGGSTGTPSEEALFSDAELIYDTVAPDHENVTVIGRSLGSGVAVYLASVRDIHQLILVTPFDCLAAVAQDRYPVFPVELILKHRFDSAARAPGITTPTLVLIAGNDEDIPRASTDRLIEAFPDETVRYAVIQDTDHESIIGTTQYYMRIRDFQITGR